MYRILTLQTIFFTLQKLLLPNIKQALNSIYQIKIKNNTTNILANAINSSNTSRQTDIIPETFNTTPELHNYHS